MIKRLLDWLWPKPHRASALVERSVVRRFLRPDALEQDSAMELARVALLVQQAKLTHLVQDVTLAELEALARAGERVADEHATLLMVKLRDPAKAIEPYDGGAAVEDEIFGLMELRRKSRVAARKNGRA